MAVDGRPEQALEIGLRSQSGTGEDEVEEGELGKLEGDVAELAERIIMYRRTIPEQLKEAFASLSSLESLDFSSPAEASGASASGGGVLSGLETQPVSSRDDAAANERLEFLKQKTLVNASAMEPLLKRMRDCISRIDAMSSSKDSIHPVFKALRGD